MSNVTVSEQTFKGKTAVEITQKCICSNEKQYNLDPVVPRYN